MRKLVKVGNKYYTKKDRLRTIRSTAARTPSVQKPSSYEVFSSNMTFDGTSYDYRAMFRSLSKQCAVKSKNKDLHGTRHDMDQSKLRQRRLSDLVPRYMLQIYGLDSDSDEDNTTVDPNMDNNNMDVEDPNETIAQDPTPSKSDEFLAKMSKLSIESFPVINCGIENETRSRDIHRRRNTNRGFKNPSISAFPVSTLRLKAPEIVAAPDNSNGSRPVRNRVKPTMFWANQNIIYKYDNNGLPQMTAVSEVKINSRSRNQYFILPGIKVR